MFTHAVLVKILLAKKYKGNERRKCIMCFRPSVVGVGPVKCPKCGAEVDSKADECPSCGAKATPAPGMPSMPSAPKAPGAPTAPAAPKPPKAPLS